MKDRISPTLTKAVRDAGHAAGKQARAAVVSTPGCAAVAPSTAGRYRHRVDRAQAEVARVKGYRKGRGSNEGPAGRFELREQVAFDDGWSSITKPTDSGLIPVELESARISTCRRGVFSEPVDCSQDIRLGDL